MLTVFDYFETLSLFVKLNSYQSTTIFTNVFFLAIASDGYKKCLSSWKLTERSDYGRDLPPGFMVNGQEGKVS